MSSTFSPSHFSNSFYQFDFFIINTIVFLFIFFSQNVSTFALETVVLLFKIVAKKLASILLKTYNWKMVINNPGR